MLHLNIDHIKIMSKKHQQIKLIKIYQFKRGKKNNHYIK